MSSTLWKICFFRPSWPSSLFACFLSSEIQRERRLLWVDALFLPAFALRLYIMISNKHLQWLFVVWLLHVIGLVIFKGIIFGGPAPVEDRFKGTTKSSGDGNNLTSCIESRNITNATDSTTSPSHSTDLTFSTALNKTEFFGPNVRKMTLCLTPLLLLLLLGLNSLQRADVDVVSTHCTRPVRWR